MSKAAYYALGQPSLAVEFYEHALCTRAASLGPQHVDTALAEHNLSCCLAVLGEQPARMRALLASAYECFYGALGNSHPRSFIAFRNIELAKKETINQHLCAGKRPTWTGSDILPEGVGPLRARLQNAATEPLPGAKGKKKASKKGKGKGKGKKKKK